MLVVRARRAVLPGGVAPAAVVVDGARIAGNADPIVVPQARGVKVLVGGTEFTVSHRWIGDLDEATVARTLGVVLKHASDQRRAITELKLATG